MQTSRFISYNLSRDGVRRTFSSIPFEALPTASGVPFDEFKDRLKRSVDIFERGFAEFGKLVKMPYGKEMAVWILHPTTALQAFQQEGSYPWAVAEEQDYFENWSKMRKFPWVQKSDPEFLNKKKAQRSLMQKELFPPRVADSYLPLLAPTVEEISQGFGEVDDVFSYLNDASLDMFFSVILGKSHHVVKYRGKNRDRQFSHDARDIVELVGDVLRDPAITACPHVEKVRFEEFCKRMDVVTKRSLVYVTRIAMQEYINRLLSTAKRFLGYQTSGCVLSYTQRLAATSGMSPIEIGKNFPQLFFAGIDTVQHTFAFLLLDLAENPEKQEKLAQEVAQVVGNGPLEASHIPNMPYLKWVLRETYRKNRWGVLLPRRYDHDIELEGYRIPKGTLIMRDFDGIGRDPKFVQDPEKYIPERWSPEAVDARKGTDQEILDHKMMNSYIFGYGPRRCLGSRVAELKMKSLIVQIVKDWKFEVLPNQKYEIILKVIARADPYPKMIFKRRNDSTMKKSTATQQKVV